MFEVGPGTIDAAVIAARVRTDDCGAVVVFTGVVRRLSDELRPVTGLHYEAHGDMAVAEFERIAGEACEKFGPCRIAASHRTGDLQVGDVAVIVAAACAHRAQAFDACEYVIDNIKARAPIWKKEHYADGASGWRENDCQPPAH